MIEERKQETVKGGINCIDAEKTATRTGNTRQRVYPSLSGKKKAAEQRKGLRKRTDEQRQKEGKRREETRERNRSFQTKKGNKRQEEEEEEDEERIESKDPSLLSSHESSLLFSLSLISLRIWIHH